MTIAEGSASTVAHRPFVVALIACPVVFASTFLYATFTGYPSWMWIFVMAGLVVPPVVAVLVVILLVGEARRARAAG